MFYCGECRLLNEWPGIIPTSQGNCELCGKWRPCFDRPSSSLPPTKPTPPPPPPEEAVYCYECSEETGWPQTEEVRLAKCDECKINKPCFVMLKDDLPEPEAKLIKLYAHGDYRDEAEWYAYDHWKKEYRLNKLECDKALELADSRPLYEVEFRYDLSTGKCVEIIHEGKSWVPDPTELDI